MRLEPPIPETKPTPIRPVEGLPFAGVPTTVAAKTGVPEIDSVLNSPVTSSVINNPVIDRQYDVPYMAGGSNPLNDPTVYIDRHVPREQTVGDVTFDPAEPWSVHENVEQHTMEILTRGNESVERTTKPKTTREEREELSRYADDQSGDPNVMADLVNRTKLGKETVVYRGHNVEGTEGVGSVGYGLNDNLISTSLDREVASEFGRVVSKIIVDEDAPALKIHDHINSGINKEEEEVLLGKGRLVPTGEPNTYRFVSSTGGMTDAEAYRVAHFEFAEPAEQAWYRAHGIDQVAAEKEQASWLPRIQHENPENPPPNLYKKPYPHADVKDAEHESVEEAPPTAEEKQRAFDIIRNAPELQPKSAQPMLQQARELGVIGPDKPEPTWEQTPAERAFEAAPPQSLSSARTPQEMRAAISPHESYASYEARTKEWISRIDNTGDVQDVIAKVAEANSYFPTARAGEIPASHVAAVAEAAGLDPKDIDRGGLTTRFDSDGKVRAVIQALNQTTEDVVTAGAKNRENPSAETAAAMLEAELRQRHVLEYTLGARADSSRSLSAWKDAVRARERAVAVPKIKADEAVGKAPTGTADIVNAVGELQNNLRKPDGPLGLDKVIKAATDLVDAQDMWSLRQKLLLDRKNL